MKNLEKVIELHEKMKNSYFYSSPSSATSRRLYEKYNSLTTELSAKGDKIEIIQDTSCSCKNVYYSMKILINGNSSGKNISFVKKLMKEVETV